MWPSGIGVELFRSMHTEPLLNSGSIPGCGFFFLVFL